jgi:large subunit ribosomal protein L9
MKIYLLKDVTGVGMAGEITKVSDGYARNKLIPENKALEVTKKNIRQLESKMRIVQNRKEVIATQSSMLAEKIHATKLFLKKKAHDSDQLYGSVGAGEIADLLTAKGFSVSKNQIELNKAIKTLGSHQVTVKLSSKLKPVVTLEIIPE